MPTGPAYCITGYNFPTGTFPDPFPSLPKSLRIRRNVYASINIRSWTARVQGEKSSKFTSSGDRTRAQDKQHPGGNQDHAEGNPEVEDARRERDHSCMGREEDSLGGMGRRSDGLGLGIPRWDRDEEAIGT